MAVITGIEDVNSGLTGWTKTDVMDSLAKVFNNLGWNGDANTQKVGVPVICLDPGGNFSEPSHDSTYESNPLTQRRNWNNCAGGEITLAGETQRYYRVKNNGTTDYQIRKEFQILSQSLNGSNSNFFSVYKQNDLTTGTEVVYGDAETTQGSHVISGFTVGQTYYIVRGGDDQTIAFAASQADALADPPVLVEMTDTAYVGTSNHYWISMGYETNPTLIIDQQDEMHFEIDDNSGGTFKICDWTIGAYSADRVLNADNTGYSTSYLPSGVGTNADPLIWNTSHWGITETEVIDPLKIPGTGATWLRSYGYASDTHSGMKGQIIINMSETRHDGNSLNGVYYKYTVSGAAVDANNPGTGRTDLNLRIHRDMSSSYSGYLNGITITNIAENWQDNDIFTIPGDQIGGTSPANDIVFGVNQAEQTANAHDGTPSIHVTTLGAGLNLYQQHSEGKFAVAKIVNDANKTYGTTYWGFGLADNMYTLGIDCGPNWTFLNKPGTHATGTSWDFGIFSGDMGLDYQYNYNYIPTTDSQLNYRDKITIASSSSTTNYPLQIRTYKAQGPQDDNFAVIQFVQIQDTKVIPYGTFTIHKGPNYGNDIFDLDHVFLGTYTEYETQRQINNGSGCQVTTRTKIPQYHYSSSTTQDEPVSSSSKAREAFYGYMRNPDNDYSPETKYIANIDISHSTGSYVDTYFRDSTYDRYDASFDYYDNVCNVDCIGVVDSSQNYYKPIKGLPISHTFAPCPYYLPDDFVMIQASVTPGGTTFRPGDTVEVATNEKYVIIVGDEYNNQEGIDGITGNTAIGMLFCGRLANQAS